MCGFSVFINYRPSLIELVGSQKRGGDDTRVVHIDNLTFVFHRLAINGIENGGQPFIEDKYVMVCNGEIYNHKQLYKDHSLPPPKTKSDCEVILSLYKKYGSLSFVNDLDGVFAFVIYDATTKCLLYSRDRYGVRPMYQNNNNKEFILSSTLLSNNMTQVPPSYAFAYDNHLSRSVFKINWYRKPNVNMSVKDALINAVRKRMMSEKPIGCLLSGGLDSSLITSIVVKEHIRNGGKPSDIRTFSIGMKGSTDLKYARVVADFLGTTHTQWEYESDIFIKYIPDVIRDIESYDITTVRASIGNWLIARNIRETTDIKVLFNGDGSDEVCSGYLYSMNAPSLDALEQDQKDLLKNICYFDVLRSDRSISSHGIEARTPFLDKDFVNTYSKVAIAMRAPKSVPGSYQYQKYNITKWYLRKEFDDGTYLPDDVLWRTKEAFSDGVSSTDRSWHIILKDYYQSSLGTTECEMYRSIFESYFGSIESEGRIIPYYWMPKWSDTDDPSARSLLVYNE
jgi:asparagine synthase (glutamine-hydrolysing)